MRVVMQSGKGKKQSKEQASEEQPASVWVCAAPFLFLLWFR